MAATPRCDPGAIAEVGFAEVFGFGPEEARAHYFAEASTVSGL